MVLGFRFSIALHLLGGAAFPGEQGEAGFRFGPTRFRQDALAAGGDDDRVGLRDGPGAHVAGQPNRRGRDGALLDAVPMLSVLRGFAVRFRPRHAATSPGWEECPEQADLRVVALMAKTALTSA
jgi:hypothetical protein